MRRHFTTIRTGLIFLLILQLVMPPGLIAQQPSIPGLYSNILPNLPEVSPTQLPQLTTDGVLAGVSGLSNPDSNTLVVHQNQSQAVIDWDTFNIGSEAWTHFDQQGNTDWSVLNRIYDQNPSLIFGKLSGDGKLFLLNSNGILFGPGSQVDVHALAASSLDIAQQDFLNNVLHFSGDDTRGPVSNHGTIQAGSGGYIYLMAPDVENAGTLDAPAGQVALAAGNDVEIVTLEAVSYRTSPFVYVTPGASGTAENLESGRITADTGIAGLYGRNVNQKGYIRSITAVTNKGRIELHASDKVTTGAGSVTETPVSDNPETVHSSFGITGGEIHVGGLDQRVINNNQVVNATTETGRIEHSGEMKATSGTITMEAQDRIYLDAGSRLDVSGEWVMKSPEDSTITAQLNSVELKNDFAQQDGVLQGETVEVLPEEGSTIGDLSAHLNSEYLTAREMATAGGEISLTASNGDIIVREGNGVQDAALIDFSGGGTIVTDGHYNTTKLVSGNQVYDISSAPELLQYDSVVNYQEKLYQRYGILEKYEGLYYGGANTLAEYNSGYIEGSDAGSLFLRAKGIVLDGVLDGSVIAGRYQTLNQIPEIMYGNYAVQSAVGVKAPRGGELIIGAENPLLSGTQDGDYIIEEVVIAADSPGLADGFNADSDLKSMSVDGTTPYASAYADANGSLYRTVLSAEKLNQAQLSNLTVHANTKISVEENAVLQLQPGGLRVDDSIDYVSGMPLQYQDIAPARLELGARAVEYAGTVKIPNGDVFISLLDTVTSNRPNNPANRRIQINGRAFLAGSSSIDVSGERIDNSLAKELGNLAQGHIDGGSITVTDNTRFGGEVVIARGAVLDVSGGYEIGTDGSVDAGEAGDITAAGTALVAEGDFRGYSLVGESGGTISLHATRISVEQDGRFLSEDFKYDDALPDSFRESLVFEDDQLAQSGFSSINLKSYEDLTFAEGTVLKPSLVKMLLPTPAGSETYSKISSPAENLNALAFAYEKYYSNAGGLQAIPIDYLTSSSITAQAGKGVVSSHSVDKTLDTYTVRMEAGSTIEVGPGGEIVLSGLISDIAGVLRAPAGSVTVASTGVGRDVILRGTGVIEAGGYTRPVAGSWVEGVGRSYDVMDGGDVSLVADAGNIVTESGSLVDISGSTVVDSLFYDSDGAMYTKAVAAAAGDLKLIYQSRMTLDGTLKGNSNHPLAHGAGLSVVSKNELTGMTIEQASIDRFKQDGFDALAFSSLKELAFSGDIDVSLARSLSLDAPLISGSGQQTIHFKAPSITLANTRAKYGDELEEISYSNLVDITQSLTAGSESSSLRLEGEYLDVVGGVSISGFGTTRLSATEDIRLTDEVYYDNTGALAWRGLLRTPTDLVVQASRIYPTTRSDYTLASDYGRITILPGERNTNRPIVSAGGKLTLAADEIDHQGYLAAPLGTIRLRGSLQDTQSDSADTVFLADGSVTTTASDSYVQYGVLDDIYWTIEDKPTTLTSKVEIQPAEVETAPDRVVDIVGDTVVMQTGSTVDISGGGVIFASEFIPGTQGLVSPFATEGTYVIVPGVRHPGVTIRLEGGKGLPAGTYSLLPAEYAYMPGAYVIQYVGAANTPGGTASLTQDNIPLVTGYQAMAGTGFSDTSPGLYTIRTASEVFQQGDFNTYAIIAGDGGLLNVQAATTILDGAFKSDVLTGYNGGVIAFSGAQSAVVRASSSLGTQYQFENIQDIIEDYRNTAQILSTAVSQSDLSELRIGSLGVTQTVTISDQAHIETPRIVLSADQLIHLEGNSAVTASGQGGELIFNTPSGHLVIDTDAEAKASQKVDIRAQSAEFNGQITSINGTLALSSDRLFITSVDYTGQTSGGLYLTGDLNGFNGFSDLELKANTDLTFLGQVNLAMADRLTIESPTISSLEYNGFRQADVSAQNINLVNGGAAAASPGAAGDGSLTLNATADITIGHGDIALDGFDRIEVRANRDVIFSGEGSLTTSGDLTFTAASLTTAAYLDGQTDPETTRFMVQAGNVQNGYRDIVIQSSGEIAGTTNWAGGALDMLGNSIHLDGGEIDMSGGWVALTGVGGAAGNAVTLSGTSRIDVSGNDNVPGGQVNLTAESGSIALGAESVIDVSAGGTRDAGTIALSAIQGEVLADGQLLAQTIGGKGGAFAMDTGQLVGTTTLLSTLAAGGFNEKIDLRARTGNIDLAAGDTLQANQVRLTADSGDVTIAGTIDASGQDGGEVEVNAGNDLIVADGGLIDASSIAGSGATGGEVWLNAVGNQLIFNGGAVIDVSANAGTGGKVHFKARQNSNFSDVQMSLAGTVNGASEVTVEGVRHYQDSIIDASDIATYHAHADTFLANSAAIQARLLADGLTLANSTVQTPQVVPGIEVSSAGDLALNSEWDLSDLGRSAQAGSITLRAEGNLNLNQSLVDHPTVGDGFVGLTLLNDQLATLPDSWAFNLIAGADLSSADVTATIAGSGDLSVGDQQVVYTENNRIRFASGRDTVLHGSQGLYSHVYMVNEALKYNIATYSGRIEGNVGRDLIIMDNAAIQSATGDIVIAVGRDLHIELNESTGSAIRTTGTAPPNPLTGGYDWNYGSAHDGGDITLTVGGTLRMGDVSLARIEAGSAQSDRIPFYRDPANQATNHLLYWDNMHLNSLADMSQTYVWSADYGQSFVSSTPTAGVATMGGGSITVTAGRNVSGQIGTFKSGDLTVTANGDMSGYFQVADGTGTISASGSILSPHKSETNEIYRYATSLALFDAQATVTAMGNLDFGTIFNPTFLTTYAEYSSNASPSRYLDYSASAFAGLTAVNGDLSLAGSFWQGTSMTTAEARANRVLPPTVTLLAGGDILLGSQRGGDFVLAPSATGNLNVYAGGDIIGLHENFKGELLRATLRISDMDPADVYRLWYPQDDPVGDLFADETKESGHAASPLHSGDSTPMTITAGGDIRELSIISAKQAAINAGGDITGLYFFGQNLDPGDTTYINAGGDIHLSSVTIPALDDTGFRNAGPGLFLIQAGGSIDLGTTQGIQNVGNAFYSALSEEKSSLGVIAGGYQGLDATQSAVSAFFEEIRTYGTEYSELLAEGDVAGAAAVVEQAEQALIGPLGAGSTAGSGNIDMTSSSIQTSAEGSDIFILATGEVNVGLTAIPDPAEILSGTTLQNDTGIFTTRGGEINVFAIGDVNVNESRMMTFRGGNITVWSDKGDINAGRGSTTAVNTGSPKVVSVYDDLGNIIAKKIVWEPPSVGSGIRTLTYDPDGFQGPQQAPEAGNAYLFAPRGIIDAGEAGIAGRNVILGATEVLNAQNIDVAGASVGVPQTAAGPSMSTLAGAGTVSETSKIAEESGAMKSAEDRFASRVSELSEQLVPKWIAVEVVGFDKESDGTDESK